MSLNFPTTALKKPSGLTAALPNQFKRPAFGSLYGFDAGALFVNEKSVSFDGTDDKMTLPNLSYLSGASAFSLSMWFKTSDTNAYLFCSYDTGLYNSVQAYFHASSSLRFIVGTGSSYYQIGTSSTSLGDGTWKHAVFRFDGGSTVKIYINGSEETSSLVSSGTSIVPSATATDAGKNATVADYPTGGYTISSHLDELAFFDSALSTSDITSIYNSGAPNDISSLSPVGWWRMGDGTEEGAGTTVYDMSSNSNDGTLVNGPAYSTDLPS